MYRLSVIIPTYRRESPLRRCLADLLAQKHPSFEVIVVDQSPDHDAETHTFLAALPERVHHVRIERPSVTAACNVGVHLARAPLLLFLDDDIEIPIQDLLECHERHYRDPTIGAVVGRIVNPQRRGDRSRPSPSDGPLGFLDMNFDHPEAMDVPTVAGANMSCRKALVLDLGGFDEAYAENAFRWETDFSLRVMRRGLRIRYDPEAKIIHHYGTPGGCDNRHLGGRTPESHRYYVTFFQNNTYFALKLLRGTQRVRMLWRLYREHALNRSLLALGRDVVLRRHRAMLQGVHRGWHVWRQERNAKRERGKRGGQTCGSSS